jgi:F420-non-reducing hydrogenase iron-sulfur subunit
MRIIRVMCSGRVDLEFILRAFSNGMDGVFVGGCRLGECNYITHGNYHALNTVLLGKRILEHIGLNPERLQVAFMSSGEGLLFARTVDEFNNKVRELGPLAKAEGLDPAEVKTKLDAVRKLVPYIKISEREKLGTPLKNKDDYAGLFSLEEVGSLINEPTSYYIDPAKCQACMICARRCPVQAIEGAKGQVHVIDQDKCIRCGTCYEACPSRFSAVQELAGGVSVPPPLPPEERVPAAKGG